MNHNFILLRGLTRESAHWGSFVPELSAAFPEASIDLLDLPGAGNRYREVSPASIAGISTAVRTQATESGLLERPVVLVAISLGGMVAWEWLQTHPEDLAAAVLINISLGGMSPFYHRLRWQCYGELLAAICARPVRERELKLIGLISNRKERYDRLADEWAKIQVERPVSGGNAFRQLFAAATYFPTKMPPPRPVLLLNSLADRLVEPSCSVAIQQHWDLECRSHTWGGHELTLDDASWVVQEILRWLSMRIGNPTFEICDK